MQIKSLINQLCLLVAFSGMTSLAAASDFRDAEWGMTLRQVLALHPGELPADRRIRYVAFDGKLVNLDVKIFYQFNSDGELFQAGYQFLTEDRLEAVIGDYQRLNALLKKRYPESGDPVQSWHNRLFEDKPEEWARAVRIGHLDYLWQHTVSGSVIAHSLSGSRREISHLLSYEAAPEDVAESDLEQLF